LLCIPLVAFAGFRVHATVYAAAVRQEALRSAQVDRGRVLRLQVDEETGLRGFNATGDTLYLEPYYKATRSLPGALASFRQTVEQLSIPSAVTLTVDEARLNARWLDSIAKPLLVAAPRSPAMLALMRAGKRQVDTFRGYDVALEELLNGAAAAADVNTERAIADIVAFVVGAVFVLVGAAAGFGVYQMRAARRDFENRVLYDNQKRMADALQTAFLNKNLPSAPNLGLHATYIPALSEAQVGGDWYDAFELPDKRILFSIGDVAGHGLDAAIVMSRARQAIIGAALHENDPGKVLGRANDAILLQDARMVTAICGYIDPATYEVTYATAGHPPPILARRDAPAAFLPHAGIPLGILANETYPTFVATASDGAIMVLYTDGVIEHKRDIIDGERRLLQAASRAAHHEDPALEIQRLIFAAAPPTDDVAILTVTFRALPDAPAVASIGGLQLNRFTLPGFEAPAVATGEATPEYIPLDADDLDPRLLWPIRR